MASAIPKSTQNKSKWDTGIFEDWRRARFPKVATLEPGGLFKHYDLHKAQSLEVLLIQMDALSLKYWLTKFIQEVAKPSRERYPPKRYTRLCVEYVVSSRKRKRSWILILPMLRTKGAVVLLYVALVIIYSNILIVQLYLGLPLYSLWVFYLSTSSRCTDSCVGLALWICKQGNILLMGLKSFSSPYGFQLVLHWVSKLIHLTRMRCFRLVTTTWIINEFEKLASRTRFVLLVVRLLR